MRPLISFLCATYNHGRYVVDFLRSLQAQTFPDWELILVDDCSTDNNRDMIAGMPDSRVKLICHKRNEGMAKSLQDAFYASSASVVSWVASDDLVDNRYVETVLQTFQTHAEVGVVYTPLQYIDVHGVLTGRRSHLPIQLSRQDLLAKMFSGVNLLHSPGMAVRRKVFESLLPLNIGMIQLVDWQIHLQLLAHHDLVMLPEPLIRYRLSEKSACARSLSVEFREDAEFNNCMDTVCDFIGDDIQRFKEFFSNEAEFFPSHGEDIPFLLGLIALRSPIPAKRRWGFQMLMRGVSTSERAQAIYDRYGVDYASLMRYSAEAAQADGRTFASCRASEHRLRRRLKKYKMINLAEMVLLLLLIGLLLW